jgi:hypothetical protein
MSESETINRIIAIRKRIILLLNELSKEGIDFSRDDLINANEGQLQEIVKRDQNTLSVLTSLANMK